MTNGVDSVPMGPSVAVDGPAWALLLGRRRPRWRALATWIISAILTLGLTAVALHLLATGLSVRDAIPQAATVASVAGQGTMEPAVHVRLADGAVVPLTLLFESPPDEGQTVEVAASVGPPPYAVLTSTKWLGWAALFLLGSLGAAIFAVWQFVLWRRIGARAATEE